MTTPWRPIDGDEIVSTTPHEDVDVHASEAAGEPAAPGAAATADVVRTAGRRTRPVDTRVALVSALLVGVVALLVVSFLALSSINDLRNQTTSANGLQRCLIAAQLKQVASGSSGGGTGTYQADVRSCLSK